MDLKVKASEFPIIDVERHEVIYRQGGESMSVGGQPVIYNWKTGMMRVCGHEVDSKLMAEIMERIKRSRVREGLDPKKDHGMRLVSLEMQESELAQLEIDNSWKNLVNRYTSISDGQRVELARRIEAARRVVEDGIVPDKRA